MHVGVCVCSNEENTARRPHRYTAQILLPEGGKAYMDEGKNSKFQ